MKESNKLKYYNIALVPNDQDLSKKLTNLELENFNTVYKDYILSEIALPHITLCPFKAQEQDLPFINQIIREELGSVHFSF